MNIQNTREHQIKIILILIFLAASLGTNVEAQTDVKWYWAYHEVGGQLLAYDADGELVTLLENVHPWDLRRLDGQTAVAMIERNHEFSAYILTSHEAYFVADLYTSNYPTGDEMAGPPGVQAENLMYPYILIWNFDYTSPLLFDRVTHEVETLDLTNWGASMRVSQDGRYLRYILANQGQNETSQHWRLEEYDVTNAARRVIFPGDNFSECQPDTYGEKWFCSQIPEGRARPTANEIIHLDGRVESIAADQNLKIALNGDWYLMSSAFYFDYCRATCTFEVENYTTGEIRSYDLSQIDFPEGVTFGLVNAQVLDEDHLLLSGLDDPYYLLESGRTLTYLGVGPCCDGPPSISPDGRWRILWDIREQPTPVVLVDLQSAQIVFDETMSDEYQWVFASGGVYLGNDIYYSFASRQILHMKEVPRDIIDILLDGIILAAGSNNYGDAPPGIYRVTAAEGRELLIPNAGPVDYSFYCTEGLRVFYC